MRPNLTLQYGMRWEYQGVFDDRTGLVLLPQSNPGLWGPTPAGALFAPGNTNGATDVLLTLQGTNNGHPFYHRDLNNFAPFLGVAWDPFKDGKTSVRASFAEHFTQDGFTFFGNASTANSGLFSLGTVSTPTGVFSSKGNPLPPVPPDVFPVSQKNIFNNVSNAQNLTNFSPDLATPYIFEWSFGIQRQLPGRWSLETRYYGNHAVKQYRAWNINEQNLSTSGLLTEFLNGQKNLSISQAAGQGTNFSNQGLAGQVPLPIFDKVFAGIPTASGYGFSTFVTNLQQNTIGSMIDTIRRSPTYRNNITNNLPLNFFLANPWANNRLHYANSGWSNFHGLELEVNRRMSNGLVVQGTYTFSKVLTDSTFLTSQNEGQNYQSLLNRGLDKFRALFDTRHSVAYNFLYPLPFGRGRKYGAGMNMFWDILAGGWNGNGFGRWNTGAAFTITSGRIKVGSLLTSPSLIRNMTDTQVQDFIGVFKGPNGVYWLNPNFGLFTLTSQSTLPLLCTAHR